MELHNLLTLDCTKTAVQCSSKKRILELISELAAKRLDQQPQKIFEGMLTREKMGNTGIGYGIAIPNGRIQGNKAVAVFLRCENPIQFDAVDNQPVDLLFALLIPEEDCDFHLNTLSSIAKKLSDKQLCRQLRQADSDRAVFEIITG